MPNHRLHRTHHPRLILPPIRRTWIDLAIAGAHEVVGLLIHVAAWGAVLATFGLVGLLVCGVR